MKIQARFPKKENLLKQELSSTLLLNCIRSNPNLHICLVLVDMEEYRLLNGWNETRKKGSSRYDRIPVALHDELYISGGSDYSLILPDNLAETFTSKDLSKCAKIPLRLAQTTLTVLKRTGAVEEAGKNGRCILYKKCR